MRRLSVFLLVVALAFLALPTSGTAQAPRRLPALPQTPLQTATRALLDGRFEEADALIDKLDARDPNVVAVKARAAIARGRYAEAETMLRPIAARLPTSEAALQLGLLEHLLVRPDAETILGKIGPMADRSDDPIELARAGRALRALGRYKGSDQYHESNAAYRLAAAGAPLDPAIQTAFGDLFFEKHDNTEAYKSYQMVLQLDAKYPPAILGAARVLSDENPPQAIALVKKLLESNPSLVDAHVFLAHEASDAGHRDEAREELKKALAINPSSLEALSLVAALDYVEDKPQAFDAAVAKVLAIAPNYGEVYRTAGDLAARNYRFDEAVTLTRRALSLDARNAEALGDLGTHLLRTGDEPAARVALEAAFKADDFNGVTKNLLHVMDELDKFVTVRDGDLVVRMDKSEASILQEYAVPLSHQALNTFAARYEFTPKGPVLIEIFPTHDDFAVRNVGLPGLVGALGICFGRVVSLDSPHARPPGEFQWEATLWHELAHVITLQMSNQRVPRWLTEGISTREEKRARTDWGREMDVAFAGMMNRGEVLKLKDLNAAFTNPKTISLAYFEASLLVEHMEVAFGQAGMNKLVRIFGQGLDTDAALKAALNTDFDQLQVGFDETLERMYGATRKALVVPDEGNILRRPVEELQQLASANPRSYPLQLALAAALRKAGKTDEAMQVLERAAPLVPMDGGKDSPHAQMAALALEKKDQTRAIAELTALLAVDFNNVEAARQLATLMRQQKVDDPAALRPVYERIVAVDPFDGDAHTNLGRLAIARNDGDRAAREFRAALALEPVDRAAAFTDLAESYLLAGKRVEAKKQTLAALEIAPTYERAQGLLLKLVER
jgi:tetratricopeptide (TPR) repeat protein